MAIITYLGLTALFILCMLVFSRKTTDTAFSILFIALQWSFNIFEYYNQDVEQLEYFCPDAIGLLLLFVLSIVGTASLYYSYILFNHYEITPQKRSHYFSAFIALITSLSCAYLANHIAIMWIFVELTTLCSAILIYQSRSEKTLEATWKYLFISSISVALIFIGILFLGLAVQQAKLDGLFFTGLMKNAAQLDEFWLKASFLLVFTGFTVKAGLAPMYTVGIDAKDKAPSPASAIFSSAIMNLGFLGIFRLFGIVSQTGIHQWACMVLIISATLSIFISATYMVRVKNYKRMFAYSSIEHMGIVMLGMASGGIGYFGSILHVILHSFAKSSLFYQCGTMVRVIKSKFIKDAGNYFEYNTFGAIVLILGFFIITAMPPSGLFVSEFLIFRSMFEAQYLWLLIIIVVLLCFIIWSMGENLFKLLFGKPAQPHDNMKNIEKIRTVEMLPQLILLLLVIYIGFYPPTFVENLIQQALINLK